MKGEFAWRVLGDVVGQPSAGLTGFCEGRRVSIRAGTDVTFKDPAALNPAVAAYIGVSIVLWAIANLTMAVRRPSAEEGVVLWRWVAVAIIIGAQITRVGLIWVVMPAASAMAQMMIALFGYGSALSTLRRAADPSLPAGSSGRPTWNISFTMSQPLMYSPWT